jgi:ABC-type multidrug transport system ATPase subunit
MTVQETLTFYATLQLPDSNTKGQRLERVAEVLAAMGLSHTVNTLVGVCL